MTCLNRSFGEAAPGARQLRPGRGLSCKLVGSVAKASGLTLQTENAARGGNETRGQAASGVLKREAYQEGLWPWGTR